MLGYLRGDAGMGFWTNIARRAGDTAANLNALLNPHAVEQMQAWLDERRSILEKSADEGQSVVRASGSGNPAFHEAQAVVDELVQGSRNAINAYYGAERLPEKIQLYVHRSPDAAFNKYGGNLRKGMDATFYRDVIETHHERFPGSLQNGGWKFASAHEIGHIINGDINAAQQTERLKHPLNHRMEIEADFMATIAHGDIKGQRDWRACLPHFDSTYGTPNNALRAKYLDRWGAWLETQGIAREGKIIDTEKALEAFPRAFKLLSQGIQRVGSHLHI